MESSGSAPKRPNTPAVLIAGAANSLPLEQLLSAIIDSSDDAIISKDLNGIITSWNRGAQRLFGYNAEEIIGRPMSVLIPADRQDEEPGILNRIRDGIRVDHYETVRRRKDGSLVNVSITVSPIQDAEGRIVGASKVARDVTDRTNAERASRLLSSIIESTDDAIISKDLSGVITSWNKSAERLLGYKAEEIIGKPVTTFIPPDRLDEEPGVLRRIARGERIDHFETIRRRKDGTLLEVSLTISPIRDASGKVIGASKILRDITAQRHADRLSRLFAAIVESSDDAIASKDLNGIITSWNKGAERLLGYTAEEIIGKPVTMLIPADHADEEPGILRRLRRGERIEHFHTVRRRKDGSLVDVSLTVSPIRDELGNVVGASKILRDITEVVQVRQRLEETVAQRTAQLQETVSELEAFSYSVAHDMRAPLRSMNSFARLLLADFSESMPPAGREYANRIAAGAARLDSLITDVLNYSRISREEMPLTDVNVEALAREIIESYEHLREHSARIEVQSPMPHVLANQAALTQCLSNLLSNAVKFVPRDRKPQVRLTAVEADGSVRICVRDNGIGISEEGQTRIFQMFRRLNLPEEFEGTGIGLTIVRKAVKRMGGRISLESRPGEGSSFCIELKKAE